MKKTIVLLAAFLVGMSSCFGQSWNRISKAIKEKQEQLYFQLTGEDYKKRETCRHCIDCLQAYHVCRTARFLQEKLWCHIILLSVQPVIEESLLK